MLRYCGVEETGTNYEERYGSRDNQSQNILQKTRISAKFDKARKN